MPVKKGKGKKGGKTKKGKAKGKKGKAKGKKKGSKSEKGDKELVLKEALTSAKLWEARYNAVEKSRQEYRENTKKLVTVNDTLQSAINQTERDTIEVIAYLKKEDTLKDDELDSLRQQVKDVKTTATNERDSLIDDYTQQISQLESTLADKNEEVRVMQGELKTVREFRKKRSEMQHQLEQLQLSLTEAEHEHKATLSTMEQKFFEEKIRLQKEANKRIADLAEKAHAEAVSNLDARTREVYQDNLRMTEALALHMENEEALKRSKVKLEMSNRQLNAEKELNQQLVKEKIAQARQHKKLIKELQDKVTNLEQSLTIIVQEFEQEKRVLTLCHSEELQSTSSQLSSLKRRCELQEREMNHVKRLAKRILDQRSEVEQFFLEALAHVKKEIAANRVQYRHDAQLLYQRRMLDATRGKGKFPLVRTFKNGTDQSTNSVYHDMDMAGQWDAVGDGKVDIGDLTWEQKEQVLRIVFAKMNSTHPVTPCHPQPLTLQSNETEPVFITQQQGGGLAEQNKQIT